MSPSAAVRGFLDALGVPAGRIPVDLDAQAALYRSLLSGRRVLVVLDNARDADQIRPLLPGSPGSVVLVTSRSGLSGLVAIEGAELLALDLLPHAEARDLLANRLGRDRVAAEPCAVDEIIERCARLPLALAVVAARAARHPDFPLAAFAAELREVPVLDAFASEDPAADVRAVFSWSYRALRPAAARLFRLLGLHPGPDVSVRAAASLVGDATPAVRSLITELVGAHLLTQQAPGRYALHDLLRAYATELSHVEDAEPERQAAVHRTLDYYLHTAHAAALLLSPHRDPVVRTPPVSGVAPEPLADHDAAMAWLTAEFPVLLAAVRQADSVGLAGHTWRLAWSLSEFLDRSGRWDVQVEILDRALAAACRLGDRIGQAHIHRELGRALPLFSRYDDARAHLRQALVMFEERGDHLGAAHTHRNLAWVADRQGRHQEALDHSYQALKLYRTGGSRPGQANALNMIGWCHAMLGDHRCALAYCRQALTLLQELGEPTGEAGTWGSLGYSHRHLGQYREAEACYRRAVDLFRGLGDRYYEADSLTELGDTHAAAGDREAAHAAWEQALGILDELGHPDADEVRTRLKRHVG